MFNFDLRVAESNGLEIAFPYCVRSWPHSAHRPFITIGWLHSSILMMTPLQKGKNKTIIEAA